MIMDCNTFKNKVTDLFDKSVDMQTQAECNSHMAGCPECRAYYDELRETFALLQLRETPAADRIDRSPRRHTLWRPAAAAAVFLLGFVLGWSHLFSTPAVAESVRTAYFDQGIRSVRNVGSFRMDAYIRTAPQENMAHLDPALPFVKTDIRLLKQNGNVFYRVEKDGGRTVVSDGETQYMWIPGMQYFKGGLSANFLENFSNLIFPERLLAMQKSAIELSERNKVTRSETDSTVVLTFEGQEKSRNLQELLTAGRLPDCRVIAENTFSKNDGLLRAVKLWIVAEGRKTLLLRIDNIQYNVLLNKSDIVRLPDVPAAEWVDVAQPATVTGKRLARLQRENAQQAAERILRALITGDQTLAEEALVNYKSLFATLSQGMKGCSVSDFEVREDSASYRGVYVFYILTTPEGEKQQRHLSLRNDNEQHIWVLDGGL